MKTVEMKAGMELEAPATGVRRAYSAPRILSREPLEVVAALCAGFNAKGSIPQCGLQGGQIQS